MYVAMVVRLEEMVVLELVDQVMHLEVDLNLQETIKHAMCVKKANIIKYNFFIYISMKSVWEVPSWHYVYPLTGQRYYASFKPNCPLTTSKKSAFFRLRSSRRSSKRCIPLSPL